MILDILIGNENEINELTNKKNLLDSINQLKQFNKLISYYQKRKWKFGNQTIMK